MNNPTGLMSLTDVNRATEQYLPISTNLQTTLKLMVGNLVDAIGCIGATLTTLEANNAQIVRAYSLNLAAGLVTLLRKQFKLSPFANQMVLTFNDAQQYHHISLEALNLNEGKPEPFVLSNQLQDLIGPIFTDDIIVNIQQQAEIEQIIAVPVCLNEEVFGCIYAASQQNFTLQEINFLTAFSHQAANALQTERRLTEIQALERVFLALQRSIKDETQTLQIIVDAVVETLGYVGAIVATLEPDNTLPVRAYRLDLQPQIVTMLEGQAGMSLSSNQAMVNLDAPEFSENLSIRAIKGANGTPKKFITSAKLFDLFRPFVNEAISDQLQELMGIKQVIAVPFYLEDEVVGNIFVATRKPHFTDRETELLMIFGQQAAVGIRNARLYEKAEERRQIAQMFGRMAFSATANIHALRNHIGSFQAFVRLIELTASLPEEQRGEVMEVSPSITDHLNRAADILDNLHKPWQQTPDTLVSINTCLNWATRKIFPKAAFNADTTEIKAAQGLTIHRKFADNLPFIKTSPDMLTEVLRVITKNAVDAMADKPEEGHLWLETRPRADTNIEVTIRDNGNGMEPEILGKIFEMGWSSKKGQGMGFGLFWAKDYIEGLGGTITVKSRLGEGTTFRIYLSANTPESHT